MGIESIPVLMNRGLDLVTPPLLAEPGVLIDCLNYEMTAHVGYRRVDGYERYDGWVDGGVASYFVVNLQADVPSDQDKITIGSLLGNLDALSFKPLYYGVVVGVNGTEVRYVPFRRTDTINNNQRVYLLNTQGITYFFTSTSNSVSGKAIATDKAAFTQELRDYSSVLRNLVTPDATAVAGITYSRDRLWKVMDTMLRSPSLHSQPLHREVESLGADWNTLSTWLRMMALTSSFTSLQLARLPLTTRLCSIA